MSLSSLLHSIGGLGLPVLCFVLAALELYCSCALLPLCYLLQGSRHQACFFTSELQDVPNSTCFGVGNSLATSSSNRMLWLHTLLLATSTSQGRFILSETMPRYRALGRKVGLEPTTLKDGDLLFYQLNYLRQRTTTKQYRILWWVEVVSFKKPPRI